MFEILQHQKRLIKKKDQKKSLDIKINKYENQRREY